MNFLASFCLALLDRFVACLLLISVLPLLLVMVLVVHWIARNPIFVAEELQRVDGTVFKRYRFRAAGNGAPSTFRVISRFLRRYSLDELPGLWSVACGDMRITDFSIFRSDTIA